MLYGALNKCLFSFYFKCAHSSEPHVLTKPGHQLTMNFVLGFVLKLDDHLTCCSLTRLEKMYILELWTHLNKLSLISDFVTQSQTKKAFVE